MNSAQWQQTCERITDAMRNHIRPFVSALRTETETTIRLVGTGSYVEREGRRSLVTCEHVSRHQPIHHRFWGDDNVLSYTGPWEEALAPKDASFARIDATVWQAYAAKAAAIPYTRFAPRHQITKPEELLFFYGYAGENAHYGFGIHQTNGTGYCTQEKRGTGDAEIFELFWEPNHIQITAGTSAQAQSEMKFECAKGYSGSLVWNTRYLEVTNQGRVWTPEDAVVTGLLRRWDKDTETLLVWRVEHLRTWLEGKGA